MKQKQKTKGKKLNNNETSEKLNKDNVLNEIVA